MTTSFRAPAVLALLLTTTPLTQPPALAAPPQSPDDVPRAPAGGGARTVSAWLPYWNAGPAYRDALRHASQLHTVSPFWYEATSATRIDGHPGAGNRRIIKGLHAAGIKVVPTVTETLNAPAMAKLLADPVRRATHVRSLLKIVASRSYDGIDLDYERMATTGTAQDRERVRVGYNALTTELCSQLRAREKSCHITVMARTKDGGAYDYRHLGRTADRVRIMGYDLHWKGSRPGPVSSRDWYDDVLRYAAGKLPQNRTDIALPGYGWDWIKGSKRRAEGVTWKEAERLRRRTGAPYRLDEESGTPTFTYRRGKERHVVWYQDARGVAAHLPVLKKYGYRHTGLWALGFEDPKMWGVLRRG